MAGPTKASKAPKALVIAILSYNKVNLLRRCLDSIFENTRGEYRVCVVDQGSTDGTRNYLRELGERVDHIATEENLGFVHGNNLVMDRYGDCDVLLLNNDTQVTPGWLDALIQRAYSAEDIGIVGAKLIYPDGRLQAAGGEMFKDASGREIGKHDDPDRYIYNQVRDVDYCSGACLFVKRATLDATGPFDTRFAPAYWEDTDLCFSARKAGFRVVYEPSATVIHHEGASFGAPHRRSKSTELQETNKPKFIAKWKHELAKQRANVFDIPRVEGKEQILVIQPFLPLFDRAAGEMRWFHTLKILSERYQVVFLARNGQGGIKYINPLEEAGITVFHTDTLRLRQLGCEVAGPLWIDVPTLLRSNHFKAVIVGFYHVAAQYYHDIRTHSPESLLIIDSFDVAFLRERRRAEVSGKDEDVWHAEEVRRIELEWYRMADMVLTVTERDRNVLLAEEPSLRIGISTDIHPVPPLEWKPDRKDLVFVGNFKHQPNEDAVVHFVRDVLPLIHRKRPDVKFYIVGNGPTPAVEALAGEHVIVTGYVPEILPYLQQCRVCVVPLRYGAGLKGKVGQAMAAGIPQVSTSIGAEGMGLVHGRDLLVADTPEDFAHEVLRVYEDPELQRSLAEHARALVAARYSHETAKEYWEEIFEDIDAGRREPPNPDVEKTRAGDYQWPAKRPDIVPRVSIVIPVYNHLELTTNCWTSIRKNTDIPYELLIIDNGSEEPVAYDAQQNNFRCIRNDRNLGFAEAVNQGIRNTYGDYVVILNNDCIVTPGWLKRLIRHLEQNERVGVVAPLTNYASTEQRIPVKYKDEESLYRFSESLHRRQRGRLRDMNKVVGMCMAMPRRVIEEVGLFDTRFGIGNFEDDDYCLRLRLAGYRVTCAEDVFVHHEGGATFRGMNVDYESLVRRNSEIFLRKWAPVLGAQRGDRPPAPPVSTVVVFQDGPDVFPERTRMALAGVQGQAGVRILCQDADRFETFTKDGAAIRVVETENLLREIDREIRRASTPFVLVLSSNVQGAPAWSEALLKASGEGPWGLLAPRSNHGDGVQRIRPGYPSPEDGLERFTANNTQKNGTTRRATADLGGWCLLVRRTDYVRCGGLSPEFRSAAAWTDLIHRMADGERESACILGSYVHFDGGGVVSEADPVEKEAVVQMAGVDRLVGEGDFEGALRRIETSLAHKPDYTQALHCRALLLAEGGRHEEAEKDWKAILRVRPEFTPAKNNLGCLAFEQGRDKEAERYFRDVLAKDPGNRDARRNLGDLCLSTGAVAEGLTLYQELVEQKPDDPDTYLALGGWYGRLGDSGGAAEWYRQALRVAPDCEEARSRLATLDAGANVETETSPRDE